MHPNDLKYYDLNELNNDNKYLILIWKSNIVIMNFLNISLELALFTLDINVWISALLKARNIHLSSDLEIFSAA